MRRSDLPAVLQLVSGSRSYKDHPEVGRALARLRLNLSSVRDSVANRQQEEKIYTSDLSRAFVAARRKLAVAHALKDDAGQPLGDERGGYRIKNPIAFDLAVRAYGESHPDEKLACDEEEAAFKDWMNEEVVFSRPSVLATSLPADATADELWAMYLLLDVQD